MRGGGEGVRREGWVLGVGYFNYEHKTELKSR